MGPVHTLPVTGYAPLHCQLLYAARLLAPVAADKSHIILSWYSTIVGEDEGRTVGYTDGDTVGTDVTWDDGNGEGATDGCTDGYDGWNDGLDDGDALGDTVGDTDGDDEGALVHATNPDPKFFVALGVKHDA